MLKLFPTVSVLEQTQGLAELSTTCGNTVMCRRYSAVSILCGVNMCKTEESGMRVNTV